MVGGMGLLVVVAGMDVCAGGKSQSTYYSKRDYTIVKDPQRILCLGAMNCVFIKLIIDWKL